MCQVEVGQNPIDIENLVIDKLAIFSNTTVFKRCFPLNLPPTWEDFPGLVSDCSTSLSRETTQSMQLYATRDSPHMICHPRFKLLVVSKVNEYYYQ